MLILSRGRSTPPAVSPEAQQYLDRAPSLDELHRAAMITLINGLVDSGVWSRLDLFYMLAMQTTVLALLNVKSGVHNALALGGPVFTIDRGYAGLEGSGRYLHTTYAPAANAVNWQIGNSHLSAWSIAGTIASTPTSGAIMGASDAANFTVIAPQLYNNTTIAASTDGSEFLSLSPSPGAIGHYIGNRLPDAQIFYNGVLQDPIGQATLATALQGFIVVILAGNNSGVIQGSSNQVAMASLGGGLTSAQAAALYSNVRTYLTAVGAP